MQMNGTNAKKEVRSNRGELIEWPIVARIRNKWYAKVDSPTVHRVGGMAEVRVQGTCVSPGKSIKLPDPHVFHVHVNTRAVNELRFQYRVYFLTHPLPV